MRWWRSLRVRLTVGFALFAVATVALAATAAVLLIEEVVLGQLDTVLEEESQTLASFDGLPDAQLAAAVQNVGEEREHGGRKFVRIEGQDGAVLAAWDRVPRAVLRGARRGTRVARIFTEGEDDRLFRVAVAPTVSGGRVMVGVHATRSVRLVQRARCPACSRSARGCSRVARRARWTGSPPRSRRSRPGRSTIGSRIARPSRWIVWSRC